MTDKSRKAVPREPTDEMIEAGRHAPWEQGDPRSAIVELSWRAMFDAAPVLATAPAEPPKDGEVAALIERLRAMLSAFFSTAGQHNDLHRESMVMLAKQDHIARTLERRVTHAERQLVNAKAALARLSAPVPELTERERGVLRHALTGGRDATPYRNHFAADEGHADMPTLRALVARGLMIERKNKSPITPDTLFHCTEAGAKAVGLHLPNDSPTAAPVPDTDVAQDDLREILRTVGLSDCARTYSPHEVVQRELLPHLRTVMQHASMDAAPVPAREWVPVGERLPDAVPVLAYGTNSHGKGRRMRAEFIRKGTREDNGDYEPIGDYDKAKDTYFWPEGWYEWNECEETHWLIDIPITHWMPLPPPPAADK